MRILNKEQIIKFNLNQLHHSYCNLINSRQVPNDKNDIKVLYQVKRKHRKVLSRGTYVYKSVRNEQHLIAILENT